MASRPLTESVSTRAHAEAGDADAQFGMGFFYAAGAAPQDYAQAMFWYQKAADQNHTMAQFNLGQMYALGHGMPKSDTMAVMWIRRAAAGGDAGAQFDLANRYARASVHGTEMDAAESRIEAYKWFSLAASQEYRNASLQCDSAAMRMSRDELLEGTRRVETVHGAGKNKS
jgi:TPR repeat protein